MWLETPPLFYPVDDSSSSSSSKAQQPAAAAVSSSSTITYAIQGSISPDAFRARVDALRRLSHPNVARLSVDTSIVQADGKVVASSSSTSATPIKPGQREVVSIGACQPAHLSPLSCEWQRLHGSEVVHGVLEVLQLLLFMAEKTSLRFTSFSSAQLYRDTKSLSSPSPPQQQQQASSESNGAVADSPLRFRWLLADCRGLVDRAEIVGAHKGGDTESMLMHGCAHAVACWLRDDVLASLTEEQRNTRLGCLAWGNNSAPSTAEHEQQQQQQEDAAVGEQLSLGEILGAWIRYVEKQFAAGVPSAAAAPPRAPLVPTAASHAADKIIRDAAASTAASPSPSSVSDEISSGLVAAERSPLGSPALGASGRFRANSPRKQHASSSPTVRPLSPTVLSPKTANIDFTAAIEPVALPPALTAAAAASAGTSAKSSPSPVAAAPDLSAKPVKAYPERERQRLAARLRAFYKAHAPDNLAAVERAVHFSVTEATIFQKLCDKYGVAPEVEVRAAFLVGALPSWIAEPTVAAVVHEQEEEAQQEAPQPVIAVGDEQVVVAVADSQSAADEQPQPQPDGAAPAAVAENAAPQENDVPEPAAASGEPASEEARDAQRAADDAAAATVTTAPAEEAAAAPAQVEPSAPPPPPAVEDKMWSLRALRDVVRLTHRWAIAERRDPLTTLLFLGQRLHSVERLDDCYRIMAECAPLVVPTAVAARRVWPWLLRPSMLAQPHAAQVFVRLAAFAREWSKSAIAASLHNNGGGGADGGSAASVSLVSQQDVTCELGPQLASVTVLCLVASARDVFSVQRCNALRVLVAALRRRSVREGAGHAATRLAALPGLTVPMLVRVVAPELLVSLLVCVMTAQLQPQQSGDAALTEIIGTPSAALRELASLVAEAGAAAGQQQHAQALKQFNAAAQQIQKAFAEKIQQQQQQQQQGGGGAAWTELKLGSRAPDKMPSRERRWAIALLHLDALEAVLDVLYHLCCSASASSSSSSDTTKQQQQEALAAAATLRSKFFEALVAPTLSLLFLSAINTTKKDMTASNPHHHHHHHHHRHGKSGSGSPPPSPLSPAEPPMSPRITPAVLRGASRPSLRSSDHSHGDGDDDEEEEDEEEGQFDPNTARWFLSRISILLARMLFVWHRPTGALHSPATRALVWAVVLRSTGVATLDTKALSTNPAGGFAAQEPALVDAVFEPFVEAAMLVGPHLRESLAGGGECSNEAIALDAVIYFEITQYIVQSLVQLSARAGSMRAAALLKRMLDLDSFTEDLRQSILNKSKSRSKAAAAAAAEEGSATEAAAAATDESEEIAAIQHRVDNVQLPWCFVLDETNSVFGPIGASPSSSSKIDRKKISNLWRQLPSFRSVALAKPVFFRSGSLLAEIAAQSSLVVAAPPAASSSSSSSSFTQPVFNILSALSDCVFFPPKAGPRRSHEAFATVSALLNGGGHVSCPPGIPGGIDAETMSASWWTYVATPAGGVAAHPERGLLLLMLARLGPKNFDAFPLLPPLQ